MEPWMKEGLTVPRNDIFGWPRFCMAGSSVPWLPILPAYPSPNHLFDSPPTLQNSGSKLPRENSQRPQSHPSCEQVLRILQRIYPEIQCYRVSPRSSSTRPMCIFFSEMVLNCWKPVFWRLLIFSCDLDRESTISNSERKRSAGLWTVFLAV